GQLTFDGNPIPGNKMNVIVLDGILENAYYTDRFDPDNPSIPVCFALGRNDKELAPHEAATDKQSDACASCEWNKMGSAETGKGKACKNQRRLMLLPVDALEDLENAQPAFIKVPVTSGKNYAKYVKRLESQDLPPLAVITEISLAPHAKHQFEMSFRVVEEIGEEQIEARRKKADDNESVLFAPYTPKEEEEAPARRPGKAPRAPAKKAARGGRR